MFNSTYKSRDIRLAETSNADGVLLSAVDGRDGSNYVEDSPRLHYGVMTKDSECNRYARLM